MQRSIETSQMGYQVKHHYKCDDKWQQKGKERTVGEWCRLWQTPDHVPKGTHGHSSIFPDKLSV